MPAKNMAALREKLDMIEGKKLIVTLRRGHKRSQVREGVMVKTYPSIFTLRLDDINGEGSRIMSFSYADILTKAVEIVPCN